jgi:hypothetical protein
VRLVVNEHLYTGPVGAGAFCLGRVLDPTLNVQMPRFRPIHVGPSSFVLADQLAYCRFSYREVLPRPAGERWVSHWTAPLWPTAVRIEMAPVSPDPSRIHALSITAPIRVNAMPMERYAY